MAAYSQLDAATDAMPAAVAAVQPARLHLFVIDEFLPTVPDRFVAIA